MAAVVVQSRRSVFYDDEASSDEGQKEHSIIHFQHSNDSDVRRIPTGQIYKPALLSKINFLKGYKIKIVEDRLFEENQKDIYLLSRDDIRSHRSKFKFLHIGLVQVSISNASMRVRDTFPVSVSLRDSKHRNFKDSVLVAMESDVYKGAMKFNWFPNFSSPLSDLATSNALVVTIDPQVSQSVNPSLEIHYRVCYKLMKTSLRPRYLFQSPVVEVNTQKTNVVTKSNGKT